jgi:hypothetical protein
MLENYFHDLHCVRDLLLDDDSRLCSQLCFFQELDLQETLRDEQLLMMTLSCSLPVWHGYGLCVRLR